MCPVFRNIFVFLIVTLAAVGYTGEPLRIRDIADVNILGASYQDDIGKNIAGAGDVDGDGYDDLVLGTEMNTCGGCTEFINFAYLVYGSTALPSIVDLAESTACQVSISDFGLNVAVAGLGDFNGDGYGDVALGDGVSSPGGLNEVGRAFILYGAPVLPATFSIEDPQVPGVMIEGGGRSAWLGFRVSKAGDINGDGYADALTVAPAQYETTTKGEAFIVYGGTDVPPLLNSLDLGMHGVRIRSEFPRSELGHSLTFAGDVNGDGFSDIVIGTEVPFSDSLETAYLIYGGTDLPGFIDLAQLGSRGVRLVGPASKGDILFGNTVSGGGDINGDGYDDFLVAAPNAAPGGVYRAGQVYVYFGGPNLPSQIRAEDIERYGVLIHGFEREARLGEALAGPGDINGDPYDDLILASPQKTEDVAILFGSPEFPQLGTVNIQNLDRIVVINPGSPGSFGSSSAFVGDVNGDGREDLMIGDRFNNETKGEAFLIYGGKFDSVTPTPTPIEVGDFSGWVLLGTGEVVRTTPVKPTPTPSGTE